MERVESASLDFTAGFCDENETSENRWLLLNYIEQAEADPSRISLSKSSELFAGAKWINSDHDLVSSDLSGRLVLLDFFTYCCINCIHVMPFLHHLELKYPANSGLLVVGVHSAKFPNEKLDDNIRKAISRYNLQHPVVNDCDIKIWDEFSVKCWPTLILISPNGKVLFSIPGESHTGFVDFFINVAMEFYQSKNQLKKEPIPVTINLSKSSTNNELGGVLTLKFPGQVAVDELGERIAISDSGNNRVIICDVSGNVLDIIGESNVGFVDGSFEQARFNTPQGVAWHGRNAIFVADCNNHAVRKIDFLVKKVITICGTGMQGDDLEGGKPGLEQQISSPWDVVVGGSPRVPDGKSILYIAMSGCHQIWAFFLRTTDYQKGAELEMGTCIRYAGNGKEENRNNSYPHKAGFAQPSGLAIDEVGHTLYAADSESSTIRKIQLTNGTVQALVGGDIDPMNLFSFGDVDGKGRDAKLQHPLGVAWDSKQNVLYVADTYNHKVKVVDPKKKICSTCELGSSDDGPILSEPSGLALDPTCENLYIADTNNHEIKILSLKNNTLSTMVLKLKSQFDALSLEETDGPKRKITKLLTGKRTATKTLQQRTILENQGINIILAHPSFVLSPDAPSSYQISLIHNDSMTKTNKVYGIASGRYAMNQSEVTIPMTPSMIAELPVNEKRHFDICIESILYHCLKDSGVCMMHSYKALLPVEVIPDQTNSSKCVPVEVKIEL